MFQRRRHQRTAHETAIVVLPAHGTTVATDSETRRRPGTARSEAGPTVEQPANLYVPQVTTTAPIVPFGGYGGSPAG